MAADLITSVSFRPVSDAGPAHDPGAKAASNAAAHAIKRSRALPTKLLKLHAAHHRHESGHRHIKRHHGHDLSEADIRKLMAQAEAAESAKATK